MRFQTATPNIPRAIKLNPPPQRFVTGLAGALGTLVGGGTGVAFTATDWGVAVALAELATGVFSVESPKVGNAVGAAELRVGIARG